MIEQKEKLVPRTNKVYLKSYNIVSDYYEALGHSMSSFIRDAIEKEAKKIERMKKEK